MKILFSHPTGNANVRSALNGLMTAGLLSKFNTTFASFPNTLLDRLGRIQVLGEVRRRRFDSSLQPLTNAYPWRELGRIAASRFGFYKLLKHETGRFSIDAVYQGLDRTVAKNLRNTRKGAIKAVYCFEDGAEFTFIEAKRQDIKCLYDLPTGHWRSARKLLEKERLARPEWASTMTGFQDSVKKLERKDNELRLADTIIVASKFTAQTLADFPGFLPPVKIIPYGFPDVTEPKKDKLLLRGDKIQILFVGKLTQQKGIANLFEAVEPLKDKVSLTVVGQKPTNDCRALNEALLKHKWFPTLDHGSVLKMMGEHDLVVFPSLFDGFGLVITEAMSQGTPVIATNRSAGPDLITHGKNGWIVEAGSTSELSEVIEELISKPELIAEAGKEAIETAKRRPWKKYEEELSDYIKINFQEN